MLNQSAPSVKPLSDHSRWERHEKSSLIKEALSLFIKEVPYATIAEKLNVPKSTLHDWIKHYLHLDETIGQEQNHFFHSIAGQDFMDDLVRSTVFIFGTLCNLGSERISEFLQLLPIKNFVATSRESLRLYEFEMRNLIKNECEKNITELFQSMPKRVQISIAEDETFTPRQTLGAMDLNSGFHFGLVFSDKRDATAWGNYHLQNVTLQTFGKVEVLQMISDEGRGLLKASRLNHIPHGTDLFHCIQEIYRGIGPYFSQKTKELEKRMAELNDEKSILLKQQEEQMNEPKQAGRPKDYNKAIENMSAMFKATQMELAKVKEDETQIYNHIKRINSHFHPYDTLTGRKRSGRETERDCFLEIRKIETYFQEAGAYTESMKQHFESAKRTFPLFREEMDFYSLQLCKHLRRTLLPQYKSSDIEFIKKTLASAAYFERLSQQSHTSKSTRNEYLAISQKLKDECYQNEKSPLYTIDIQSQQEIWEVCKQGVSLFQRSSSKLESIHRGLNSTTRDQRKRFENLHETQIHLHNIYKEDETGMTALEKITGQRHERLLDVLKRQMRGLPPPANLNKYLSLKAA